MNQTLILHYSCFWTPCSGADWLLTAFLRSEWIWWISFCVCQHIRSFLGQECHRLCLNNWWHS